MAKGKKELRYCMFCGRREDEVPLLLQGIDACICSDCVKLAEGYLEEFNRDSVVKPGKIEKLHKPQEIHAFLDGFTVRCIWPLCNLPKWSWWSESNQQPSDYKSDALPLSHTSINIKLE